jgi:hypothetical protein
MGRSMVGSVVGGNMMVHASRSEGNVVLGQCSRMYMDRHAGKTGNGTTA